MWPQPARTCSRGNRHGPRPDLAQGLKCRTRAFVRAGLNLRGSPRPRSPGKQVADNEHQQASTTGVHHSVLCPVLAWLAIAWHRAMPRWNVDAMWMCPAVAFPCPATAFADRALPVVPVREAASDSGPERTWPQASGPVATAGDARAMAMLLMATLPSPGGRVVASAKGELPTGRQLPRACRSCNANTRNRQPPQGSRLRLSFRRSMYNTDRRPSGRHHRRPQNRTTRTYTHPCRDAWISAFDREVFVFSGRRGVLAVRAPPFFRACAPVDAS